MAYQNLLEVNVKPKILLVNDDGIHAPGLKHLWEVMKDIADLVIVAPSSERSGAGTSISMHIPLHLTPVSWPNETPAYSLSGTPADCVKMALAEVLDAPPDLILSGINPGSNAGRNVFYSGTVGGAIEGILHNVPSGALSCESFANPNYAEVASHVPHLVNYLIKHPLPADTLLNVNFPRDIKGLRLAKQGKSFWKEEPDCRKHPDGFSYYWLAGRNTAFDEEEESDVALIAKGFAAAVPIRIAELTHEGVMNDHAERFALHFSKNPSSL